MKTQFQLQQAAEVIRQETVKKANTADRVGQMVRDLADASPGTPAEIGQIAVARLVSPGAYVWTPQRGIYNVQAWGADPAASDNSASLQAAFDFVCATGRGAGLYFPAGNYQHSQRLDLKKLDSSQFAGVRIFGDGGTQDTVGSRLTYTGTGGPGFRITTGSRVCVEHLSFYNAANSTATAVEVLNSWRVTFNACEMREWGNGMTWTNTNHGIIKDCFLTRLYSTWGVKFAAGTAGVNVYDTLINPERTGTPSSETVNGYIVEQDCDTIGIYSGAVLLCNHGVWVQATSGRRPLAFRTAALDVEHAFGKGYNIEGSDGFDISGGFCSQGKDDGVFFSSAFKGHGRIRGISANGNGGAGIRVENSPSHIEIDSAQCGGNSDPAVGGTSGARSGIELKGGVSNVSIFGGKSGGDLFLDGTGTLRQKYGIDVQSGSGANIVIVGTNCEGNLTGRLGWGAGGSNNKVRAIPGVSDIG